MFKQISILYTLLPKGSPWRIHLPFIRQIFTCRSSAPDTISGIVGWKAAQFTPRSWPYKAKRKQSLEAGYWLNVISKGKMKWQDCRQACQDAALAIFCMPCCSYQMLRQTLPTVMSFADTILHQQSRHHFPALTSHYRMLLPVTQGNNNVCYLMELLAIQRERYSLGLSANISRFQFTKFLEHITPLSWGWYFNSFSSAIFLAF